MIHALAAVQLYSFSFIFLVMSLFCLCNVSQQCKVILFSLGPPLVQRQNFDYYQKAQLHKGFSIINMIRPCRLWFWLWICLKYAWLLTSYLFLSPSNYEHFTNQFSSDHKIGYIMYLNLQLSVICFFSSTMLSGTMIFGLCAIHCFASHRYF